jgi:hypothetical protein
MSTPLPPIPPMPKGWEALALGRIIGVEIQVGQFLIAITDKPSPALTAICILMAHWWGVEQYRIMGLDQWSDQAVVEAIDNKDAWRKLGGLE